MILNQLGVWEAAQLIHAGRITSEALVTACLDRIRNREREVFAWAHIDPDAALAQARSSDRGTASAGPLKGVPIAIKDVIDTSDMPSCYGSSIFAGHRPRADASCVALLRNAGAVILGKTHTAEFASTKPPPTRHPRSSSRTPGGSSSGSAAAVADHMVPGALGTQTGGSIIRPAGYCGVVGYKPSFGMVNRAGLKFSAESMDTIGTFARSVLDVSILAHVLSSHRSAPQTSKARSLRVRILKTEQWGSASGEAQDALMRAVGALKAAGHSCFDQELPAPFRRLHDAHLTMMNYEIARSAAWEFRSHESLLSNEFAQRVRAGMKIGYEEYCRAAHEAAACRLQVGQEFTKADVFLTLSTPGEAPVGLESTGPSTFNKVWTLLHLPCANLPFGSGSNGFPLGVQLIGAPGDDQQFLSDAAIVEAVLRSAAAISSGCKEQHDKT